MWLRYLSLFTLSFNVFPFTDEHRQYLLYVKVGKPINIKSNVFYPARLYLKRLNVYGSPEQSM